ncbi:MAG: hypothetical protein FH759_03805 [Sediminimonas qiaohouensis]|uniref:DUF6473 domain-containing protein n=1 Tax=Sediminimonas qiaohouensis TaxID=552061 RepID=A0A7C9HKH8_9RHOB|nr:DUF6473 family protein [Sediminimonas qiaohouensis]MTJ03808.1 hypothetical protein [Sediminimonas qiaohouensis]
MTYADVPVGALDYMPWRYADSKLVFRGPRRRLEGQYALFLGGTETYGRFIADPFPAIVERRSGLRCVNFGWPNAGVDAFAVDPDILYAASQAIVNVVQITGAHNVTNPFYSVHPRRNDRFVAASAALQRLYPEVDFMEFHFTRHMLGRLWQVSPDRYAQVRAAAQNSWVQKMRGVLHEIGSKTILLWISERRISQSLESGCKGELASDPVFVTAQMIAMLRPYVARISEVVVSDDALAQGTEGMVFSASEAPAAAAMPGPLAHREVAEALVSPVMDMVARRH